MWEERFDNPEYIFGTEPAQFLLDHREYLRPGQRALSVADGEGRNSVFMAQQGVQVSALEFAPSAIRKARALALARQVDVDFHNVDVLNYDWPDQYDLVAGIFIQFVGADDRRHLFSGMKGAVRPGGIVMLHGYTPEQLALGTGGPPFEENMYTEPRLRAAFEGWNVLECRAYRREIQEGSGHSGQSALIDFIARRPIAG